MDKLNKISLGSIDCGGSPSHDIKPEQIEKFNNLLGALICHGKDSLDYDYVEDDMLEYFIEEFLYSLDNNFKDYLRVRRLYKKASDNKNGPTLYIKSENDYKSDIEVEIVENDKSDICSRCACGVCQAAYDNYCPGEEIVEKNVNCNCCSFSSKNKNESKQNIKNNFKRKCDGKFEAVKNWCIECSSFDMLTPLVVEWREKRKKINFRRAIKSWREVYRYVDSFCLEDENDTLKEPIYPFRYWYWTCGVGNAIEYGLWGIIDYYNICNLEEKEWYWYKRMQTYLPSRQEGDVMPHMHFNKYIHYIMQYIRNNESDDMLKLRGILEKIQEEADVISSWGQNGLYSMVAPGDSNDLNTMPCTKEYYIKIENICKDFMEYIKSIMKIRDEHDVMRFIGYGENKLGYVLQI